MRLRRASRLRRFFAFHRGCATKVRAEGVEFGGGQVGNGSEEPTAFGPLQQRKAVPGLNARFDRAAGDRDRHFAQRDLVLAPLIDERRHRGVADDVDASADQWKPLRLQIDDSRGARDLAGEPWLDGVAVRRRDVDRLTGETPPDEAGDDRALDSIVRGGGKRSARRRRRPAEFPAAERPRGNDRGRPRFWFGGAR